MHPSFGTNALNTRVLDTTCGSTYIIICYSMDLLCLHLFHSSLLMTGNCINVSWTFYSSMISYGSVAALKVRSKDFLRILNRLVSAAGQQSHTLRYHGTPHALNSTLGRHQNIMFTTLACISSRLYCTSLQIMCGVQLVYNSSEFKLYATHNHWPKKNSRAISSNCKQIIVQYQLLKNPKWSTQYDSHLRL
jgi:hypothetical protein